MRKRIMMSDSERKMLNANRELVERQKMYLRDISRLISYIKGNICVKSDVESIIKYYTTMTPGERVNEVEKR